MSVGGGGGGNTVEDTPEQRHLASVAAEKWNYAQEELAPLENDYIDQVGEMDSPARKSYLRGRTQQGQHQSAADLYGEAHGKMAEAGIDPSSGRYMSAMDETTLAAGQSGGETSGRAEFEQDSQQKMGLQNVVSLGQGQAGQAQQGLSDLSSVSSSDARNQAVQKFNRRNANLQLLGQVAGAGTRYGLDQAGGSSGLGTDTGVNQSAIDASTDLWE